MRKIDKRQGLMLCAAGILVLVMLTVFVRLGTTHILVKRAHMDNFITQMILYGNADLQKVGSSGANVKIDWEKAYPFADIDSDRKMPVLPTKKIESKAASVEKKVDEWTGKHLLGYYKLSEVGRGYEQKISWNLISPAQEIVPLGDGAWSFAYPKVDISDKTNAIADLAHYVEDNGAKFVYIQAPFKIDPYGDFAVNGRFDFTNQNCDDLLEQLQDLGIATMDLRQNLHRWAQEDKVSYHDFFFRTDHHWKPETALRAAKVVGGKLREYGIEVDESHYDLQDFDVEVLPNYFLGSQGKRATLAKTTADDFSILHPKFANSIHFVMPELGIDEVGGLEVAYDMREVSSRDYYGRNPYGMYGYGDRSLITIDNLLMKSTDKNVLLIKDSFSDTMGPFLSLGLKNLVMLDSRAFTGSIKAFIEKNKPDVVILMYTAPPVKPIDWSSHSDKFDFR